MNLGDPTQTPPPACPKCGSLERERGRVYEPGTFNDIRFQAFGESQWHFKKQVTALACSKCGYVEFYLTENDTGKAV
jgi:predicted nucleic-acid-binding Zn-ribbon protein